MIVQSVIPMIIVQNFLMENILENACVRKTITMKIALVLNAHNFGKIIT